MAPPGKDDVDQVCMILGDIDEAQATILLEMHKNNCANAIDAWFENEFGFQNKVKRK